MKADSYTALAQLNKRLETISIDREKLDARRKKIAGLHNALRESWAGELAGGAMTPAFVAGAIREVIDDDTIVLNEAITSASAIDHHLPRTKPGTLFYSGGSSLGWCGGAAVGMKLAAPEKDVVALAGDGTYVFSCPTAVYWMARRYNAPFMTVIFNNGGWNAPRQITKGEHPDGYAERGGAFWTSFDPPARLDLVAEAAGGAFARTVTDPAALKEALLAGREAIRSGIPAVINVIIEPA